MVFNKCVAKRSGSLSLLIRSIVSFLPKENLKIYLLLPLLHVLLVIGSGMANKAFIISAWENGGLFTQNEFPAKNNEKSCSYFFLIS